MSGDVSIRQQKQMQQLEAGLSVLERKDRTEWYVMSSLDPNQESRQAHRCGNQERASCKIANKPSRLTAITSKEPLVSSLCSGEYAPRHGDFLEILIGKELCGRYVRVGRFERDYHLTGEQETRASSFRQMHLKPV